MPPREEIAPGRFIRCFEWQQTPALVTEPPLEPTDDGPQDVPFLAVDNLRAGYWSRGERLFAARDVSFAVGRGESVALVGESGSGKTTIARCVAGLHEPWSGRVLLEGAALATTAKNRSAKSAAASRSSSRTRTTHSTRGTASWTPLADRRASFAVLRHPSRRGDARPSRARAASAPNRAPVPAGSLWRRTPARRDRPGPCGASRCPRL